MVLVYFLWRLVVCMSLWLLMAGDAEVNVFPELQLTLYCLWACDLPC